MKKCLNCGAECQDEDLFCPKCGERLIDENACQKCGSHVDPRDDFCRHCGHKIEKEYKCEKCGVVINQDAKFCPECGTKVVNPEISVKRLARIKSRTVNNDLFSKIVFFVFGGTMILLFVLALIGCFGDIFAAYESPRGSGLIASGENRVSIDYFFGKAFKTIEDNSRTMNYPEYKSVMIIMLIIEYALWVTAIASIIAGAVYTIIKLYKGHKNKNYTIKSEFCVASILGALPYLFIFAIQNEMSMTIGGALLASKNYTIGNTFGWGTMIIFVVEIVAVCLFVLTKIALAIKDKKNIVRVSIGAVISIAFFAVFVASLGKAVGIYYSETGGSVTGFTSVFGIFTSYLSQYSSDLIQEMPPEAFKCLTGSALLMSTYLIGALLIETFINKPEKSATLIIMGALMIGTTIAGSMFSMIGAKDAFEKMLDPIGLGLGEKAIVYSGMGIALPIVTALSVVGHVISQKIKFNNAQA